MENYENKNNEIDVKLIISKNIIKYRKKMGLTQLELAEKLNYSDKTLSKWERGESMPDIVTLKQLADIFMISVDVLISTEDTIIGFVPVKERKKISKRNIISISLLSAGIVWFIATIAFVILNILPIDFQKSALKSWIPFIYAIPITATLFLIFDYTQVLRNTYLNHNQLPHSFLIESRLLETYFDIYLNVCSD